MLEKIKITKNNGEILDVDVIATFKANDFNRSYIIYSNNELDPNGLAKLSVAQLVEEAEAYSLKAIETDEEWTKIKDIMRQIITGGNV